MVHSTRDLCIVDSWLLKSKSIEGRKKHGVLSGRRGSKCAVFIIATSLRALEQNAAILVSGV
jgi:hypothetical protein